MRKVFSFLALSLLMSASVFGQSMIKVNQVGYYPDEEKVAVVEADAKATTFTLKDSKGKTVWSGKAVRKSVSPFSNKERQVVDFSKVTKPGKYTLHAGRYSQLVIINQSALAEIAQAGMQAFYLQRTGTAIEKMYAGKYARPAAHPDNAVSVHLSAVSDGRPAGTIISSPYGWYDAGDYNKYIVNSGFTVGTLLGTYELYEPYLSAMKLNIPENTNDVPDFLDEIMYNLKWMITMQDPADGGVYHKLTTPNFEGFVMPTECHQQRYVVQKSTPAALDFAATMALASRIYNKYPVYRDFAEQAKKAAEKAYAWAVKNPTVLYDQPGNNEKYEPKVNTGMYDDSLTVDEFFWASTELYFTTKQNSYLEQAKQFIPKSYKIPVWGELAGLGIHEWMTQSLTGNTEGVDFPVERMKQMMIEDCEKGITTIPTSSFNSPHGNSVKDFPWGSNAEHCAGQGIAMIYAYKISGDKKYLNAALENADYLLGRNATGYCFVTGFGTQKVMHPHQRLSAADGIEDPLPGFLAGGPNPGQQDAQYVKTYPSKYADESYTDDQSSYASNEIAINWNAYLVSLMASVDAELGKK